MPDLYGDVKAFMDGCGQSPMRRLVSLDDKLKLVRLRMHLIEEEARESTEALEGVGDAVYAPEWTSEEAWMRVMTEATKELCDLLYVTIGAFIALGLPYEEAWQIVQASNMEKVANPRFDVTGKLLKPEGWVKPDQKIKELFVGKRG